MKTYKFKAILSIMLVMLMAFLLPVQVFAQTLPEPETPEDVSFGSMNDVTTANIVSEIEERRDETTKHFRMDDGTIMAVNYGSPVHYKNSNGKWIEYNNSLIAENDTLSEATADEAVFNYVNKKSDIDIKVAPDSRNEKMIHIGAKKGDISWKYSGAKLSNAKIKNNNRKYKGNEKFTNVDKMTSTAKYENIYENVDLECIVSPTGVKENLILENKDAQNEFEIVYDIKDLTAKQIDDKTIQLYNEKNKKTYKITAPYMYDAEKNVSEDLTLEILSNKNNKLTVKLVADKSFLRSWGRQYPVTIDPEVVVEGRPGIMTAQVCKNTPNSPEYQGTHFYVGVRNGKEYCGLVKSEGIEDSYADKNVVSAKVKVFTTDLTSEMEINAYAITDSTASWIDRTATYNMLTLSNDVIDYDTLEFRGKAPAVFDITRTFKQWCRGEVENNGILLESDDDYTDFGGYAYYYDSGLPRFEVIYKEYNGSESHLTSHTVSSGNKGQMSVVHYTGDMVFKQELYSESGSRLPLEIYATYHSAEKTKDNNTGYGWHMSFDKTLTLSDGYYIYTDGDAVKHYFKVKDEVDEEGLTDENDLGYTLKIDSTNSKITIDDGSVIYTFATVEEDETSKIQKETDVDNSNNCITYTYNSGNYITGITSSFGNYRIEHDTSQYNASGKRISNIILPDLSTIVPYYFYNANIITNFRFGTNQFATFAYDQYTSTGTMIGATTKEYGKSYRIICDYNANGKVQKILEQGYNQSTSSFVNGKQLFITYGTDNTTTYTDNKGRKEVYTFDEYGNTVSILNADGYLQNEASSGFNLAGGSDSYTKNYITNSNEPEGIGSGFEYKHVNGTIGNNTSSGGTTSIDSPTSYLGSKSIKINHNGNSQFNTSVVQTLDATEFQGGAVTFSAYVKLSGLSKMSHGSRYGALVAIETIDNNGASHINNSTTIPKVISGSNWQRLSTYADISADITTIKVHCTLYNAQGTAWFDCLQLEEGYIANDYNALKNSDFESTSDWYIAEVTPRETTEEDTEPYTTATSAIALNNSGKVEIQGIGGEPAGTSEEDLPEETEYSGPSYEKTITETEENGIVEETDAYGNVIQTKQGFVTREYTRIYKGTEPTSSSEDTESSEDIVTEESTEASEDVETEENGDTTTEETETEKDVPCNKYVYQTVAVNKANVSFNISGTAKAKSVPLNNENRTFGIALKIKYEDDSDFTEQHYQEFNYATTAKQGVCLTVSPEISNKFIETVAFAFVYGYNRNTMTVENAMLNFAYDIATGTNENTCDGNSQQTTETEAEILSETLESETVSEEKEYMMSSAEYDSTGNLVTSQTDEAGNTISYGYDRLGNQTSVTDGNGNTTSYSYDKLGNLTAIVSGDASNTYTYDDQFRLSSISHNEFAYNFNYDIYGQLINAKVGNQSLISYTYSNRGLLTSMTYGNGDVLNYSYDSFDRLILITKGTTSSSETTSQVILSYNKKGLVGRTYDYILNEHTYYDYDIHGNLISKLCQNQNNDFAYGMSTDKDGNTVEMLNIEGKYTTITSGTDDKGDSFVNYHGVTVTNESDDLGRKASVITKFDNGTQNTTSDDITAIDTEYDYKSGIETNSTTNLVDKITHTYGENTDEIYQYKYDANGNIIEVIHTIVTELEDGITKQTEEITVAKYEYDSLNQLTVAKDKKESTYTEYTYDDAGNITEVNVYTLNSDFTKGTLQSTNTYSYDSVWKDKLSSYNGETITYDEIGNPLDYRNGISMNWDNGRQLQSFTKNNVSTTYNYDADGMRVRKNGADGNTQYYYDSDNNLIALCYTPTTGTKKVLNFFYDSEGSPVSFQVNSLDKYFYVKNLQGDIEKIINAYGEVLVTYTYDAWGNIVDTTDNSTNNLSTFNPFRYRGYAYDAESGFYYLQSRYYDPQTGRFLNADETKYLGATKTALSCNLFSYCENNSVNKIDPTGYWSFIITRGMVASVMDFIIDIVPGLNVVGKAFAPFKILVNYYGRKLLKKAIRSPLRNFLLTFVKFIGKISKYLLSKASWLAKFGRNLKTWKIPEKITLFLLNKSFDKFINFLVNNIDIMLSIGGMISGFFDIIIDKKLNNKIFVFKF